ncbi:MAG: CDP-glycerol glycerophosphotransferase family protein [Planctomycetota bacterium JB042]
MSVPPRRRVLFPVSTPLSLAVVEPLVRRLAADPRLSLRVTSRHVGRAEVRSRLGPEVRTVPSWWAPYLRFDAAVCPGFFFHPRRRTPLVQMFHGVSPKNYAARSEVERFDTLFVCGEYHRRKFVRAGVLAEDDPRGVRVGMPKTDRLVAGGEAFDAEVRAARGPSDRPVVLYAPTRSGAAGSSLESFGLEVVERLVRGPAEVVVKLHDRSDRRYRRKLKVDYEAEIRRRAPGARVATTHDVVPFLAAADVLVTDLSSVAGEFMLLDRPIVFLSCPEHEERIRRAGAERFGDDDPHDLDWLRAAGEVADDASAAEAAVERALADPAERSALRCERAELLFYHPGRATEVAATALLGRIGLEST